MARTKGSKNTVHSKRLLLTMLQLLKKKQPPRNKLNQKSKDCPKILAH